MKNAAIREKFFYPFSNNNVVRLNRGEAMIMNFYKLSLSLFLYVSLSLSPSLSLYFSKLLKKVTPSTHLNSLKNS